MAVPLKYTWNVEIGSDQVAQAPFEPTVLQLQSPKCWDSRQTEPGPLLMRVDLSSHFYWANSQGRATLSWGLCMFIVSSSKWFSEVAELET